MTNFFEFPNIDEEDKHRRVLLSIFMIAGIPTLLLFTAFHFLKGDYATSLVDALASIVFSICLVRLKNASDSQPIFRITTTILVALLLYLLMMGGQDGSAILWMYTFPIVVFLLFGKNEGLFWIAILFFLAMVALFFPPFPNTFQYGDGTKIRFPISFFVVSFFSYYIEAIRSQAQTNLIYEEEKSQKYLDVAGVMLTVLNSKGEITLMNQKGCEILGVKEDETIGKNWFDHFISKDIVDDIKEVFSKLMAGKTDLVEYYENPVITKAGDERVVAFHNTLLTDDEGIIRGVLSSGEDITDRKLLEIEREDLIDRLTKAFNEIKTLQGIIPICSHCKNIRDEKGLWNKLEAYIHNHSDVEFSHSVCPKCVKEHYSKFVDEDGNF